MSAKSLSPAEVWKALPESQQWRVLCRLLERYRKRLPAGAVGVAIGYRTLTSLEHRREHQDKDRVRRRTRRQPLKLIASQHHPRVLTSELCVRFHVKRKLRRPVHPLPKVIATTVQFRGRRRRCDVPTDVGLQMRGRPQCLFRADDQAGSGQWAMGAACCTVTRAGDANDRFLLGCHHVFALSKPHPRQPLPSDVSLQGVPVGTLFDFSNLTPADGSPGFDAALVRLPVGAAPPPCVSARQPSSVMVGGFPPKSVEIITPRGVILAEFQDYSPAAYLVYAGRNYLIGPIFRFAAATADGDSGSPVMNGRELCGMHFYGYPQAAMALAHPAESVFRRGRFHVRIGLA